MNVTCIKLLYLGLYVAIFLDCGFMLHLLRSVMQETFWQGQASPFQELMSISILLNTTVVCTKRKLKIYDDYYSISVFITILCDGRQNVYLNFCSWFLCGYCYTHQIATFLLYQSWICIVCRIIYYKSSFYFYIKEICWFWLWGFTGYLHVMWFCCFCQLALELVEHLRAMGETNALFQRNPVSI